MTRSILRAGGVVSGVALLLAAGPLCAAEQNTNEMPTEHHHADLVDYPTLCTNEDWIVFNGVSDVDAKLVSVCMNEGDDSTPSHLTFRYGTEETVEIVYPEKAEGSFDNFVIRRYTRPQTTYLVFEMTREGRNYEVLAGGEGEVFSAHLQVIQVSDGSTVMDHDLTVTTAPFALMALEKFVPAEPFDR